jgi:hypothetical protein
MEVVKRRKQFQIDIRRKRKREFFYCSRENIKNQIKETKMLQIEDKEFIEIYEKFMKLGNGDIDGLMGLSESLRDKSFNNLNCVKQFIDLKFIKKIMFIMNDIPQIILSIEEFESQSIYRKIFENLCELLYNLMCENEFRSGIGVTVIENIDEIILANHKYGSVKLSKLLNTYDLGMEESNTMIWMLNNSEYLKMIFSKNWDLKQKINENYVDPFFIEFSQIQFINFIIITLNDFCLNHHTLDNQLIENFLQLLDHFLSNLKNYFDFIKTMEFQKEGQIEEHVLKNLMFWEEHLNKKIVNTLHSIFFAMKNCNVSELSDIYLVLNNYDISILQFGLDFGSVLKDSESLNHLIDILYISLESEGQEEDLLCKYFLEIDIKMQFLNKLGSFNSNQIAFGLEYLSSFMNYLINDYQYGIEKIVDKIPYQLIQEVISFMNPMMEPLYASDQEYNIGELSLVFLQKYIFLITPKTFEMLIKDHLNYLCALFKQALSSKDKLYIEAFIYLMYLISYKLSNFNKVGSFEKECFGILENELHLYCNQDLYFEDEDADDFEYDEKFIEYVFQILLIINEN